MTEGRRPKNLRHTGMTEGRDRPPRATGMSEGGVSERLEVAISMAAAPPPAGLNHFENES